MTSSSVDTVSSKVERRIRRTQNVRIATLLIALAVIGLLALDNREDVSAGWVVGDGELPLYVLILVSWAVGVLTGRLTAWRRHRR